jgi:hypothetical protein
MNPGKVCKGALLCVAFLLVTGNARAVPSFTRQTGLACEMCHSVPPELTAFGRRFKMHGYTFSTIKQDVVKGQPSIAGLELNQILPVSAMFQAADTGLRKAQPGTQNGNVQLPQALSLFLAGEMTPHVGGFVQATYTQQDDHFGLDNTDIRFADHGKLGGKHTVYGVTLNNNPTVEDPWSSTPAWGFPWIAADSAPSPSAAPIIAGALAQDVAGVGAYAMWNDFLYGDVTVYRSAHLGGAQPPAGTDFQFNIHGVAPYWRVAAQHQWGSSYLMVGTYGMHVSSFPQAVAGRRDRYTNVAADSQFEQRFGRHLISAHGTYIRENSDLRATAALAGITGNNFSHHLNTVRLDGTYHFGNRFRFTLAFFSTTGDRNRLLYSLAPVSGSADGKPDSRGYILQGGYWLWENLDLSLAYTGYTKFNGAGTNYDGAGRNASANNSVYVTAWFIF